MLFHSESEFAAKEFLKASKSVKDAKMRFAISSFRNLILAYFSEQDLVRKYSRIYVLLGTAL